MYLFCSSRKRPPSYLHDCDGIPCDEEDMKACNAALILMNLSNSPKSPKNGGTSHYCDTNL